MLGINIKIACYNDLRINVASLNVVHSRFEGVFKLDAILRLAIIPYKDETALSSLL